MSANASTANKWTIQNNEKKTITNVLFCLLIPLQTAFQCDARKQRPLYLAIYVLNALNSEWMKKKPKRFLALLNIMSCFENYMGI